MATAANNINKVVINGISRFLSRDFFSDHVSLLLSFTSHSAAFGSLPRDKNSCQPFTSLDKRAG